MPGILPFAGNQLYAAKKCGDCHVPALPAKTDSTKLAAHLTAMK